MCKYLSKTAYTNLGRPWPLLRHSIILCLWLWRCCRCCAFGFAGNKHGLVSLSVFIILHSSCCLTRFSTSTLANALPRFSQVSATCSCSTGSGSTTASGPHSVLIHLAVHSAPAYLRSCILQWCLSHSLLVSDAAWSTNIVLCIVRHVLTPGYASAGTDINSVDASRDQSVLIVVCSSFAREQNTNLCSATPWLYQRLDSAHANVQRL